MFNPSIPPNPLPLPQPHPIPVPYPGPTYATDLHPLPGTNIMMDYGANDTISYTDNGNDMTVTIHGGNDKVYTGVGDDIIFDDPASGTASQVNRSSGDDEIHAGYGNDTIFAGDGRNIYDGGCENFDPVDSDTIDYSRATVGVKVNLETGVGQGNGTDTLISIENVTGSNQGDTITGSSEDNVLKGG